MNAIRTFSRRNVLQWRRFSKSSVIQQTATAGPATPSEPLIIPTPEGVDKIFSPKLEKIAIDISNLNLLEVSELSQLLKKKLNLPDQPMMPMGGFAMQSAPVQAVDEVAVPQKVKTEYTVKMMSYDEKQKVALIKEVKNILEGYNLVQAKKFVESLPTIVKENISKDEAEKLSEAFTKVGAVMAID